MLFQIEGTQVYLVGSIHFGKPSSYPFSTLADKACDAAKMVYFESRLVRIGHLMRCPPGHSLSDYVSSAVIEKLKSIAPLSIAPQSKLDFNQLMKLKPWGVVFQLEHALWFREGDSGGFSVENYFLRRAKKTRARIRYLEMIEEPIAVFDAAPK